MQKAIYNLEFPDFCNEMTIAEYRFSRVPDYQQRMLSLNHKIDLNYEFHIPKNTGTHARTAIVNTPKNENKSILPWIDTDSLALNDVLLLLSLFTCREVFAVNLEFRKDIDGVLIQDPRLWYWGGTLRSSIPYKGIPIVNNDPYEYDIGFEEELGRIYKLIRSSEWQEVYQNGYYLILARSAFRLQNVDDAFIHCWTIWEHLFAIHNSRWMSEDQIEKLPAVEKISCNYPAINKAIMKIIHEKSK
jgi:hypothetical protein